MQQNVIAEYAFVSWQTRQETYMYTILTCEPMNSLNSHSTIYNAGMQQPNMNGKRERRHINAISEYDNCR